MHASFFKFNLLVLCLAAVDPWSALPGRQKEMFELH